jgi:phosphopantothenoylcysteine decarboxylase / phosphopantothenate---cysteine ligase
MRKRPPRVLVTAGPTREFMDDVRFLSNASTGLMGWEIAREAKRRGAKVTLVIGPCERPPIPGVETISVVTTRDLLTAARRAIRGTDLAVFAAAPSDWRPLKRAQGKIKKDPASRVRRLVLVENPDVAATLGHRKNGRVHVGFALEVQQPFEYARRKLYAKNFDAIVLNGPENVGPGKGGAVWWIARGSDPVRLPASSKVATARALLDHVWDWVLAGGRTRG